MEKLSMSCGSFALRRRFVCNLLVSDGNIRHAYYASLQNEKSHELG